MTAFFLTNILSNQLYSNLSGISCRSIKKPVRTAEYRMAMSNATGQYFYNKYKFLKKDGFEEKLEFF
jgi:hypothetical protein